MIQMRSSTWMNTEGIAAAVKEACMEPLKNCAIAVVREVKSSMKQGGTGSGPGSYYHSLKGRRVMASPPGTPPNVQTGVLRNSIKFARIPRGYVIGPTSVAWYGRIHEFGLRKKDGKVMRPFMYPALYRVINNFTTFFNGVDLANTSAAKALSRANIRGRR